MSKGQNAGCFWSVELAFQRVRGVFSTTVGYTQGHLPNPVYEDVKKGTSGHVETVEVSYNESLVSLETLLETFWWKHDASSKNKQGNDKGTQYRSGVYYFDQSQKEIVDKSVETQRSKLEKPWHKIWTEVEEAKEFYIAEPSHQQYLVLGGRNGNAQSSAVGCSDPIRCYG